MPEHEGKRRNTVMAEHPPQDGKRRSVVAGGGDRVDSSDPFLKVAIVGSAEQGADVLDELKTSHVPIRRNRPLARPSSLSGSVWCSSLTRLQPA
jgi:hypothetical protein